MALSAKSSVACFPVDTGSVPFAVNQHQVRNMNWSFFFNNSPVGVLSIRFGMAFHHIQAFYFCSVFCGTNRQHTALFAFEFAGNDLNVVSLFYM